MRFVLPSSNLEHVVALEPSCVQVPFCYLDHCITEFVGSCKMCNLVIFYAIYNGKNLVFWVVILFSANVLVVCEIPEFFL